MEGGEENREKRQTEEKRLDRRETIRDENAQTFERMRIVGTQVGPMKCRPYEKIQKAAL